jgi:hypothetical protein
MLKCTPGNNNRRIIDCSDYTNCPVDCCYHLMVALHSYYQVVRSQFLYLIVVSSLLFLSWTQKKITKKVKAATNTASRKDRDWRLLPHSFVVLLCIVNSAFVILLLDLLRLKYK